MFKSTRIKLTAWYLLIIMFISLCFSAVIYRVLDREVERFILRQRFQIERRIAPPIPFPLTDPQLIEEVRERLLINLGIINLFILIASGILGYFLAGKTLEPISKIVEEQDRFITDASHELRTPLTALKTSMEVNLRDKNLDLVTAKKIIKDNIEEVNKLQSLSDNLLELAQYEKLDLTNKKEIADLNQVIKEAIKKISPLATQKNIQIKNHETIKIKVNSFGLINLLVIILDNAVKYSPPNNKVEIKAIKSEKNITISVEDCGIGIDQKDIPYIFDRFYRASNSRTKNSIGGYGLGLSIAKKIIEIHKGKIDVESQLKKGAVFRITMPIINY